MQRPIAVSTLMAVLCLGAAIWALCYAPTGSSALAAEEITSRAMVIAGQPTGEVLVAGKVVLRIRSFAGGFSPAQRAEIVAQRIAKIPSTALKPELISTGRINGMDVVTADGREVVTVDPNEAKVAGTTPYRLARLWAANVRAALSGQPQRPVEPVGQKVVPILSVGSGLRVGGALVTGPKSRLDDVKAVAQLETDYQDAVRIKILVPVSTEDVVQKIARVPETSVAGLVDIKL